MGGKTRDRVRCYMHVGAPSDNDTAEGLAQDALKAASEGFTAVRFSPFPKDYYLHKSYSGWADEAVNRVGAVREAVGPDVDICVEIHRQMNPALRASGSVGVWNSSARSSMRTRCCRTVLRSWATSPSCATSRSPQPASVSPRSSSTSSFSKPRQRRTCVQTCVSAADSQAARRSPRWRRVVPRKGDPTQPVVAGQHRCLRPARRLHTKLRAAGVHRRVGAAEERPHPQPTGACRGLPDGARRPRSRHRAERGHPCTAREHSYSPQGPGHPNRLRRLSPRPVEVVTDRFLPGVPVAQVEAIFNAAPGNEIVSGKFDSPESSAALAEGA